MKSISVKLREPVFTETEQLTKILHENRNSYINQALDSYNKQQKRLLLAEQFKRESALVAADSMTVLAELEQLADEL
jgi:metal-responsive CopG/Arc/MetJ family transcriptional regulator